MVYNESSVDMEEPLIFSRTRPRASPKPSVSHKKKGTPQETAASTDGPSQQEKEKETEKEEQQQKER